MHTTRPRRAYAGLSQPAATPGHTARNTRWTGTALLLAACTAAAVHAQDTLRPPQPVTYTQKYEVYGGINYSNGQAGQNLPKRFNMAGGEVMATDWLTPKYGIAADARYTAGTTPVLPGAQATSPHVQTRPLVSELIYMGGLQYHWGGNQHVGVNLHALAGAASGDFDHSNPGLDPAVFVGTTGLYSNHTSFMGTAGGSFDFNRSARWAVRVSPEIVFEHFGTELREFVYVSGGVLYRFGDR